MPHLKSVQGIEMTAKYVKNWYSVLAVYCNIKPRTIARFKNGKNVPIHKRDFLEFYEEIYRQYLVDNGFKYLGEGCESFVKTPSGIRLKLFRLPYSFVLDEVFKMKVYGQPDLSDRVAVDIGSSIGDSSLYFASLGAVEVHGFEVDRDLCNVAEQNIKLNNLSSRVIIHNEKATSNSLEILISKNSWTNVFIKIDCEGCEYEIIRDLSNRSLNKVQNFVIEYHGDAKPIINKLKISGFRVSRIKEIIYANRE
jgi:tRNA/tmRNA/rRNA uracil-C5-methylase (TrmA/RlmC/RlmD family)